MNQKEPTKPINQYTNKYAWKQYPKVFSMLLQDKVLKLLPNR